MQTGSVSCPFEYPNMETALRAQLSAGPVQAAIAQIGEEGEDTVRKAIASALKPFERPKGSIVLKNKFQYTIGTPA